MPEEVDLYDSAYKNYALEIYRQIRVETYGEDLGQTSWVTATESNEIPKLLELATGSQVLEIGCGSGRYALRIAERITCKVIGLDVNPHGVRMANELARAKNLSALARFEQCDVSEKLPFEDETFDAAFSNDVLCHVPGRPAVLRELFRILKPGGRLLFSDALIIDGLISQEEIATRSSIGFYIFSVRGVNEQLIRTAGFRVAKVWDTTDQASATAERWRNARRHHEDKLRTLEGNSNFEGLQRFLSCVHELTHQERLRRFVYLAFKG
jgi:ubiquinone/menaquinone biosynthesis C-methylase UbiE